MVGHQTVRPYLDSCSTSLLGEQIAIDVVVPVLEKYSLPPVPALGHVMRKAGNDHAGKARHLGKQGKKRGIGIMSTHLSPSFTEIPRLQNDHDIAVAFPNLDIEPALTVGNVTFDKSLKKPGDIFVDVNISYSGIEKGVISTEKMKQLIAKLKMAGVIPALGAPMLTGRVGMGVSSMDLVFNPVHPSVVLYIDPAKKGLAEKLVRIASEFVTFPQPQTQLVQLPAPSTSNKEGIVAMMWAKSGFDAQIFISAP